MPLVRILVAVLAIVIAATPVEAQCTPGWSTGFGASGLSSSGSAAVVFDDGSGPALYVGGNFTSVHGVVASRVARFDGTTWSPLGSGMNSTVSALAVYDDGQGPKLYAGGDFTTAGGVAALKIARWNGVAWEAVGAGLGDDDFAGVRALTVYSTPDGQTSLYATGGFYALAGAPADNIARWDGSVWSSVGSGSSVYFPALAVHDLDGAGPGLAELFALTYNGAEVRRWNGTDWIAFPGPTNGISNSSVSDLVSFDPPGPGAHWLVASINYSPLTSSVRAWDGTTWFELGAPGATIHNTGELCVFDAGTGHGRALYAANRESDSSGTIQRWTGSGWEVEATTLHGQGFVSELVSTVAPRSGVPTLYALGAFAGVGGAASTNLAQWNGTTWSGVGAGGQGIGSSVRAFAVHDDGGGPALYAVGTMGFAPFSPASSTVLRWNGASWISVGDNLNGTVTALASFDDGSGPALYAGGKLFDGVSPSSVLRWDGVSWSAPGGPLVTVDWVADLCVFDDGSGSALYAAAVFGGLSSGAGLATRLVRWDGLVWSAVPGTQASGWTGMAALEVYDDGSGEALYACGDFTEVGDVAASYIARWNGSQWSAVGEGLTGRTSALTVADFGDGPELAASSVYSIGGQQSWSLVVSWNGSRWKPIGNAVDFHINDLCAYDDGDGSILVASQSDTTIRLAVYEPHLLRWDGSEWTPFAGGSDGSAHQLKAFDDGSGRGAALWVAGHFGVVGDVAAHNVARYVACTDPGRSFCFGDGSGTQCPCGNNAPLGTFAGCTNSFGEAAKLHAHGRASLANDGVRFEATGLPPFAMCLLFQGSARANGGDGDMFGDGLLCAGGTLGRIARRHASAGGTLSYPTATDLDVHVSGGVAAPGLRAYQLYYRNSRPYCTTATFNLTNGFAVQWIR